MSNDYEAAAQACDGFEAWSINNPEYHNMALLPSEVVRASIEWSQRCYLAGHAAVSKRVAELEGERDAAQVKIAELLEKIEEQASMRRIAEDGLETAQASNAENEARCASMLQFVPDHVKRGELQTLAKKYAELEAERNVALTECERLGSWIIAGRWQVLLIGRPPAVTALLERRKEQL